MFRRHQHIRTGTWQRRAVPAVMHRVPRSSKPHDWRRHILAKVGIVEFVGNGEKVQRIYSLHATKGYRRERA